jgi:hypothetical protein
MANVSFLAFSNCVLKVNRAPQILTELAFLHDGVQVFVVSLPNLQLDFEASAVLVLDVL